MKLALNLIGPIAVNITHCINFSDLWTLYDLLYIKIIIILWKNIFTQASGSRALVYTKYRQKLTNRTGKYATQRMTLFQS